MHLTTLADPSRTILFSLMKTQARALRSTDAVIEIDGVSWSCNRVGNSLLAIPSQRTVEGISLGQTAERLLWIVHYTCRLQRQRTIHIPTQAIREHIWGEAVPANWRRTLNRSLFSIAKLRVGIWNSDAEMIANFNESLPLFERINDHQEAKEIVFEIGRGFLGSLEAFASDSADDDGYDFVFPTGKPLKHLRKDGVVHDAYLPCYLGNSKQCKIMPPRCKNLLQVILRELTVPPRNRAEQLRNTRTLESGLTIEGSAIPGSFGRETQISCRELYGDHNHVGFNGNGVRRGLGYKISTWVERAGYEKSGIGLFLQDLERLATALGLIVGAVGKGNAWIPLSDLLVSAKSGLQNRGVLRSGHLRIYTRSDFVSRWNRHFGWGEQHRLDVRLDDSPQNASDELFLKLRLHMERFDLNQQKVAKLMDVSKQYLSAVMLGKKNCSKKLEQKVSEFILRGISSCYRQAESTEIPPPDFRYRRPRIVRGSECIKKAAIEYHKLGWNVIPMKDRTKKPHVKWKNLVTKKITRTQVDTWWSTFSTAGIAVILGPTSNLFCIDVDGRQPHGILLQLLGEMPNCPTIKSGSGDPYRYHLLFQHPPFSTNSRWTPLNFAEDEEKLEFRGSAGLLVLPPSQHPGGKRYAWCRDRHYQSTTLPKLPVEVLRLLRQKAEAIDGDSSGNSGVKIEVEAYQGNHLETDFEDLEMAKSTAEFLAGELANSDGSWNSRLFQAGCDLAARKVPQVQAKRLLLRGAAPRTPEDRRSAIATIESAFSQPRAKSVR